jgi:DNA processing protein
MTLEKILYSLTSVKGLGGSFIKNNLQNILHIERQGGDWHNLHKSLTQKILREGFEEFDSISEKCYNLDIKIIGITNSFYPDVLKALSDPPSVLYVKGDVTLLNNCVAVIGSRASTNLGNRIANKIGEYFSTNYSICNGLVAGIDYHAICYQNRVHSHTVGVLGGGLNYKATSSKTTVLLADKVLASNGVLISEVGPDEKENKFSGSKASRIQAGLAKALILVQSSENGGSKYTLKPFVKLNRPLGIVSYSDSVEYTSEESFSMNRRILLNRKEAIHKICNIKRLNNFDDSNIVPLSSKSDYINLVSKIK